MSAGSAPGLRCGGLDRLDRLDRRWAGPSDALRGFETLAWQAPQPPVAEEVALRPSRSQVSRGCASTTAHRACRDARSDGSGSPGVDRLPPQPALDLRHRRSSLSRSPQPWLGLSRRRSAPSAACGGIDPPVASSFLARAACSTFASPRRPLVPRGRLLAQPSVMHGRSAATCERSERAPRSVRWPRRLRSLRAKRASSRTRAEARGGINQPGRAAPRPGTPGPWARTAW
jgi:hypothetical protein